MGKENNAEEMEKKAEDLENNQEELQEEYLNSYTSGVRGKILQKRHGDKGKLAYE